MKDFRNLEVWSKAHQLTLELYESTRQYPSTELYGLTSQIRRAGVSVPANIAEGCGRNSDPDLRRFLSIAMGSACELDYLLLLSRDLGLLHPETHSALEARVVEVKKMLATFIRRI